jgi:transposase InsO family protein
MDENRESGWADERDDDGEQQPDDERETWPPDGEEHEESPDEALSDAEAVVAAEGELADPRIRLGGPRRGRRLKKKTEARPKLTAKDRLLILDTWKRSGLPGGDFAPLVGLTKHTLYAWKKKFDELGPAGLMDRARGRREGSRLPDLTRRAIVMLKEGNPEYGCQRISDMLARGPALPASPSAVARVLKEAGYELEEMETRPHRDHPRSFERARPNELWQTDIFTFVLKRQNRRVYLVGFMDDHSRFVVGYGLHASQSTALVLEALRSSIANYGAPKEILTDNGTQYVTWRGKSAFSRELESRGIAHVVAKPRRPQTLGKIERFWGTLWRECVEAAVFVDLEDARRRIGHFVDHYNLHRTHQGIDGLVPADRFFEAAPQVLASMRERVAKNALELARHGTPKQPFYVTGSAGGKSFAVHAQGDRVYMTREGEPRQEVELNAEAPSPADEVTEPAPGTSPLDEGLAALRSRFGRLSGVDEGER